MNLYSTLKKIYPQNSYGGQCFTWLHRLIDFPSVGNLLGTKIKSLNSFGIPISKLDTFKVGDIILQQYPVFGHGSLINAIVNGQLQLSESNFSLNGRIDHTRLLSPQDKGILGVFRGAYRFNLPPINYPIVKHVLILQNNQPVWNSMVDHLKNLQQWWWNASGQRIQLVAHFGWTNLSGWETEFTGPVIAGANVERIKESWYDANVLPLVPTILPESVAKPDIIVFNMKRDDWRGTVFDHPELIELGYCYEKQGMTYPIKIFTISDEHDDFPPYYPAPLSAFAKLVSHEISHGDYGIASNIGVGFDFTHNWFYGQNGYPIEPERIFDDFNYQEI